MDNIKKIEKFLRKQPYSYKQPELFINLTYKCPLRCKFCYVNYQRDDDFTLEELEYLFENVILGSSYIKLVTFFGGEPLLHYDYIEKLLKKYYERCCNENIHLAIITSMAINGEKLLKLQEQFPYFEIVLSFDYFSSERVYKNNKPYRILDNYDLNDLSKHKRNICFHIVIDSEKSFQDLKLCQDIFKEYGILYSWCWNKTPNKKFDVSEYKNCLEFIIKENIYYPKQFMMEVDRYLNHTANGCGIGSELFLSSNGDISPCSISHYNNQFLLLNKGVIENNEEEIQNYEQNIFNNPKCNNCNIKGFCNGGCIIGRINNGDFNTPNEYQCFIQKQVYEIYNQINQKYNLNKLNDNVLSNKMGNLDYCYNTSINIDMYDSFNLKA